MIFWPIIRKDFIAIRLERYYFKPEEVFFIKKVLNQTDKS